MLKKVLKKGKILLLVMALFVSGCFLFSFDRVSSNATQNLNGWAWEADNWSDFNKNGIQDAWVDLNGNGQMDMAEDKVEFMDPPGGVGWISFNCTNTNNCDVVDYGVDVDAVTGDITGYAWSSNYGWLKFGGLSGFPIGSGTISTNAKINTLNGKVEGWARFCSGADDPVTCLGSNNVNDTKHGGWDGWVSLSGVTSGTNSKAYGVTFVSGDGTLGTPGYLGGYAWGGDDGGKNPVGWIKFTNVNYQLAPSVTISASPKNVPSGGSTVISWIGENLINSSTGCQTSGSSNTGPDWYNGGVGVSKPSPLGAYTTPPLSDGTYSFSIQCLGADGVTLSNIATVKVVVGSAGSLNFFADPATVYPPDFTTTLKWQALNTDTPLINCTAESGPPLNQDPVSGWQGQVADAPVAPQIAWQSPIKVDYNPTRFKITCLDQFGNPINSEVSAIRGSLLESLTLKSTAVVLGPTGEYTSDFSWSAVNMESGSCVGIDGGPNWPGPKSGPPGEQLEVIVPITAPDYTTYRLKCIGKYSGDQYVAEIQLNEGSKGTFSIVRPKYTEN